MRAKRKTETVLRTMKTLQAIKQFYQSRLRRVPVFIEKYCSDYFYIRTQCNGKKMFFNKQFKRLSQTFIETNKLNPLKASPETVRSFYEFKLQRVDKILKRKAVSLPTYSASDILKRSRRLHYSVKLSATTSLTHKSFKSTIV